MLDDVYGKVLGITVKRERLLRFVPLAGPGLLAVAHLITMLSLVSFGTRSGGYPLRPIGFGLYVAAVVLACFGLITYALRWSTARPTFVTLLVLSAPALASFLFWSGLGGPFAPWGHNDHEVVELLYPAFAAMVVGIAVVYASFSYLCLVGSMQIALYFGAHALPHYFRYPSASPFGIWPQVWGSLVCVYLTGMLVLALRVMVLGGRAPGVSAAGSVVGLIGAGLLLLLLHLLPANGAAIGWNPGDSFRKFPAHAWDWTLAAAQGLALLALIAAAAIGVVACGARLARVRIRMSISG